MRVLVTQSTLAEDVSSRRINGEEIGRLQQAVRYDGVRSLLVTIGSRDCADMYHPRLQLGEMEMIGVLIKLGRVVVLVLNGDRQRSLCSPCAVCYYDL